MYSDTTRLEISVRSVLKRRYSTDFCILVLVCGTPMSCELKIGATAPSAQWRQFSLGGGCQPPQPPPLDPPLLPRRVRENVVYFLFLYYPDLL